MTDILIKKLNRPQVPSREPKSSTDLKFETLNPVDSPSQDGKEIGFSANRSDTLGFTFNVENSRGRHFAGAAVLLGDSHGGGGASERGGNQTAAAAQGEAAVRNRGRPSTGVSLLVPGPLSDDAPPPRELNRVDGNGAVDEVTGGFRARGHGVD